jgi:hypothetical protein
MILRRVLLHFHIFKNAGTTIEDILAQTFFERFARFDKPEHESVISSAEVVEFVRQNPAIQAVSSHQLRYPLPAAPGILFFDLCFLRDPLDRIRSSYDYFRVKPVEGNEVSDLANSLALGEFLECLADQHPWRLNDVQVNILAGRGVDDDPAGPADLERALGVMLQTPFLGVVDRFHDSLSAARHFLRPVFPYFNFEQPPANVSDGMSGTLEARTARLRSSCRDNVWKELLRLNALDYELIRCARAEVSRRLSLARARGEC